MSTRHVTTVAVAGPGANGNGTVGLFCRTCTHHQNLGYAPTLDAVLRADADHQEAVHGRFPSDPGGAA